MSDKIIQGVHEPPYNGVVAGNVIDLHSGQASCSFELSIHISRLLGLIAVDNQRHVSRNSDDATWMKVNFSRVPLCIDRSILFDWILFRLFCFSPGEFSEFREITPRNYSHFQRIRVGNETGSNLLIEVSRHARRFAVIHLTWWANAEIVR